MTALERKAMGGTAACSGGLPAMPGHVYRACTFPAAPRQVAFRPLLPGRAQKSCKRNLFTAGRIERSPRTPFPRNEGSAVRIRASALACFAGLSTLLVALRAALGYETGTCFDPFAVSEVVVSSQSSVPICRCFDSFAPPPCARWFTRERPRDDARACPCPGEPSGDGISKLVREARVDESRF
jgi:hypothetical protein